MTEPTPLDSRSAAPALPDSRPGSGTSAAQPTAGITEPTPPPRPAPMKQPVTMDAAPLSPPPPSRYPDDADVALAKVATPWVGLHHIGGNKQMAEALAAWLTARGIY